MKRITLIISSSWHLLVGGIYQAVSEHVVLKVDVLEEGKIGKPNDFSVFDKGQIVLARQLNQSINKTAALVGCSQSAVVNIYQKWSKEGTMVNWRQGHGRPSLTDACGDKRLWSNPTDELLLLKLLKTSMPVRKERCQNTHCIAFSFVWGCIAADQAGCPCGPLSNADKCQQWASDDWNWSKEQWEKVAWFDESCFL